VLFEFLHFRLDWAHANADSIRQRFLVVLVLVIFDWHCDSQGGRCCIVVFRRRFVLSRGRTRLIILDISRSWVEWLWVPAFPCCSLESSSAPALPRCCHKSSYTPDRRWLRRVDFWSKHIVSITCRSANCFLNVPATNKGLLKYSAWTVTKF